MTPTGKLKPIFEFKKLSRTHRKKLQNFRKLKKSVKMAQRIIVKIYFLALGYKNLTA